MKNPAIIFFLLLVFMLVSCSSVSTRSSIESWEKYHVRENLTTQQLVEEMGIGINMGNTLEACGDWFDHSHINNFIRAWGATIPTEQLIAGYAKAGFNSLRIPVAWSNKMNLDGYIIHPDLLDIVDNVVNWTIDNGMVALVNLHWDMGWWENFPNDYDECMKRFTAIWSQVSGRLEKYGDRLMFESLNEVGFDEIKNEIKAYRIVNEINQAFVDTVRAGGGNNVKRHLLVSSYYTGTSAAYSIYFKVPDDPAGRTAVTVHYYSPPAFAILGSDASWAKAQTEWGTPEEYEDLYRTFDALKKFTVDRGIPIVVGEYAACGDNKTQEMKRLYTLAVTEAVYSRGMCPMLWDTPGGEYNRETFTWRDPILIEEMMAIKKKYPRN